MKILLTLAVLAAACRAPKPPEPSAEAQPAAETPADQNRVEKYVGGLQSDVARARDVQEKANAASKLREDQQKALQQAEGQ
jgi:hypothetical protein